MKIKKTLTICVLEVFDEEVLFKYNIQFIFDVLE
jgi:hypothetical protein